MFGAELQIQRGVCQIAQHCARRRVLAGAASVKKCVSDHISPDEHRVEHVIHAGQDVRIGNQRRVNGDLDRRTVPSNFFNVAGRGGRTRFEAPVCKRRVASP